MTALNIGELARKVGIQTSAIRYYEEVGLMPAPERVGTCPIRVQRAVFGAAQRVACAKSTRVRAIGACRA